LRASASSTESEIKLRLDGPQAGREALARLGARLVTPRHLEDNQLYDDPAGTFAGRGSVVRLRRTPAGGVLTFKGPRRVEDGIKSREELETAVAQPDVLALILARLGLRPTFRYQKYREVYDYGEVEIVLDETPVGTFLELEGVPEAIHAAAAALGYGREDYVSASYAALHVDAGGSGDMLFP
jgi:adenylate cyclase class 2